MSALPRERIPARIVDHFQVRIWGAKAVSLADEYRAKAALLAAEAKRERDPARRAQLESLERSYLRLAIQADKNAATNIVYETPPERPVRSRSSSNRSESETQEIARATH